MKTIKISVITGLLLACSAALFSFSSPKGGDVFEIYLNNKMVIQQFVYKKEAVKNIALHQTDYNDQLSVSYSHCGVVGKNRSIIIKDAQNNVLKQWRFTDVASDKAMTTGSDKSMACKVKDIMELKTKGGSLGLYYSSKEIPEGKLLAWITTK